MRSDISKGPPLSGDNLAQGDKVQSCAEEMMIEVRYET